MATNNHAEFHRFNAGASPRTSSRLALDLKTDAARRRQTQNPLQLGSLNSVYKVIQPIPVTCDDDDGEPVYEIAPLGLFAMSETAKEAIKELRRDVIALCQEIFSLPRRRLGPLPRMWRGFLKQHVSLEPHD